MAKKLETCRLPAGGFTETLTGVYDWAKAVVAKAKECLGEAPVKVLVWAYRHQSWELLAVDFHTDDGRDYSMTFMIGDRHDFELSEPSVPDMTEALHMVGILCEALGATIQIGRRGNEVNPYCTPEQWQPGQTSGQLALATRDAQVSH